MARLGCSLLLALSLIAAAGALGTSAGPHRLAAEPLRDEGAWNASVTVSLSDRKPISPLLFGIFFEEASGGAREGGWRRRQAVAPAAGAPPPLSALPAACRQSVRLGRAQPAMACGAMG